jgi:hypothetical protein
MVALPPRPEQEIIERVYAAIKKENGSDDRLSRIGSSSVGNECMRAVWLQWRRYAVSEFDGRMLRLFGTGHWQESRIVDDLRRAGFEVFDKDTNGEQFQKTDATGHFITKIDGIIKGVPGSEKTPHLLEIKTHNKNSFSGLEKHGVLKQKPEHYAQMQSSMSLFDMSRGLHVAVCKDNEQYYVERIKEDKVSQKSIFMRVEKLVSATLRPAGVSDDGSSFTCKYCDMRQVCLGMEKPIETCRSCAFSRPVAGGEWMCAKSSKMLSKEEQLNACEFYEVL